MPDWSVSLHDGIHSLTAEAWDACAGSDNPFVSHAFLSALEDSGSVSRRTGWMPRHVSLHAPDGTLAALCPAYLKGHSWGEYVFDQGWARAFEAAGGQYYPKLQVAVPFTPAPGPRLLVHPDAPRKLLPCWQMPCARSVAIPAFLPPMSLSVRSRKAP